MIGLLVVTLAHAGSECDARVPDLLVELSAHDAIVLPSEKELALWHGSAHELFDGWTTDEIGLFVAVRGERYLQLFEESQPALVGIGASPALQVAIDRFMKAYERSPGMVVDPARLDRCAKETSRGVVAIVPARALAHDPKQGKVFLRSGENAVRLLGDVPLLRRPEDVGCPHADHRLCADVVQQTGGGWTWAADLVGWRYQPSASVCTGLLVEEDRLVTARHCLDPLAREPHYAIAGLTAEQAMPATCECEFVAGVSTHGLRSCGSGRVWRCPTGIGIPLGSVARLGVPLDVVDTADLMVYDLAEVAIGATPLADGRVGTPATSETCVYGLGHPLGIPLVMTRGKLLAGDGATRRAELSMFQGSSGSPVFACEDNRWIGVLTAGMPDFECDDPAAGSSCAWMTQVSAASGTHSERVVAVAPYAQRLGLR